MSTSPDHQYLVYSDQTSLYGTVINFSQIWQYNQLFCQTGFMWNSALNFCVMCLYYCQSCSKSISQCDSCQPGRNNRYNIDNNCQCLQGYFNDGNLVCKQCPYFCQNCSQVTNGQVSCLSCPKDSFRNDNNSCTCQDGYYDTGITNCQKCDQTCLTCSSSSTNCVTCDPNSFRKLDASNKCICIDGYQEYQPPQIKCVSSKCSSTCDTCSQPQNPQACLTCLSNRTLVQISNTKVCQCNQRFYEDSSFICQPCDESCLTCNGNQSDNCLTCDISLNRVIDHLSSTCICKDGYYEQGGLCVQCDQTCQTCSGSGPQSCLSCIQNQNRNLSQNYQCICNQGYFSVDNNQVCKKCADNCQICDNFQPLKCKVCLPNLNRKLNTQNGNCDCQDGYFQVGTNSLCSKCDEQCKKCSISSNNCLSCSDPLKIIQGSNCICQEGYFQQEKSRLCLKCISNCLKCKDQKYCIQCKQNFELSKNNQCVQVIPSTIPKETVKQVSNSTQTTVYTSVGSTVAGSILLSSFQPNSSIATQLLLLQKFNFMLLINISYPQLLHEFFLIFGGSSPITSLYKFNIIDKYIIKNNDDPVYISDQFKQEDVSDSILKNSGGCVVIIIIFWLISLPFIVQYKKNTTILNAEEIRSTSTKIIKNVSEDYYPYLLVLIHQVLSLILFFSVFLQISAFIKFNPLSDNYFIPKLILLTIVGIYIFFILGKTTLIVNSIVNYEQDGILHSTEKIEQQIYSNVNLNQKGNTFFRRNYKLTQITIENILIPIFIIFVGFDSKIQLSLCLGFYVLLFILTAVTIPMKYFIDNLFLMLDQCCWIILYATILFIAYKIELIPDLNQMSNTDLQIFTTLSWVGVGCCIIILLLNPIYLIAQLIIQRKELKSSIKEICVKIKQIFSKKQPQDQNNISNYDNVSLYDFTLRNTSKLWDRSTLHKQQMLEQYKSIRQLQSNSFSIFSNQPSINQVKKIRLNKQVEIYRKQEIETHSKFNSIQQPIQEQKQENQKSNQKK